LSSTGFIARHSDRIFGFQQSRTRSRYYLGWRVLMFCWCGGSVCSYLGKNIFSFWTSQQTEVRKHYFALHCLFFLHLHVEILGLLRKKYPSLIFRCVTSKDWWWLKLTAYKFS